MGAKHVAMIGTILFSVFVIYEAESVPPNTDIKKMKEFEVKNTDATFYGSIPELTPAGKPVELILKVRNDGKPDLQLDDDVFKTFRITVKSKDGKPVPKTSFAEHLEARRMGSDRDISLSLNKQAIVKVDLARLFDLTLYGDYVATIECMYYYNAPKIQVQRIKLDNIKFAVEGVDLPYLRLEQP